MLLSAPITLFIYNWPKLFHCTVKTLVRKEIAAESNLITFPDGTKNNGDTVKEKNASDYQHTISGFKNITVPYFT